jgi:hypothetical protein
MENGSKSRTHLIRHPGPRRPVRQNVIPGFARKIEIVLPAGSILMDAVAQHMNELGCDSAMLMLDGLQMGPHNFVKPTMNSPDGRKVAWYSETYSGASATIEHAMASVGRRDGKWWLHCHAAWDSETTEQKSGHLLPDQITVEKESTVICFAFNGGLFDVTHDDETQFDIFRAKPAKTESRPTNAAIVTLAPFEDLGTAMPQICKELAFEGAQVLGLGSLIGADFKSGPSMEAAASEVLLLPGATPDRLPIHAIGADGNIYRGEVLPGHVPVCITFELMLVNASA